MKSIISLQQFSRSIYLVQANSAILYIESMLSFLKEIRLKITLNISGKKNNSLLNLMELKLI